MEDWGCCGHDLYRRGEGEDVDRNIEFWRGKLGNDGCCWVVMYL